MRIFTPIIAALAISCGCSSKPPMVPVTGTVTLNGKPIENCKVCFYPEEENANPMDHGYGLAMTDAQGQYSIQDATGQPGIFPGRYKIVLVQYTDIKGRVLPATAKPSETPGGFVNQIPTAYEDPRTSPETVEVPRKGLVKDFAITK